MLIWSNTGTPKSPPAALSRVVMLKSSSDGIGSPDGWLCARMIDAALVRMAGLKTSLGCTKDDVRVPIDTVLIAVIRFFPFNMITKQCSLSASNSNGLIMCAMSFGSLILLVADVTYPLLTASSFIWRILYMAVTLLSFKNNISPPTAPFKKSEGAVGEDQRVIRHLKMRRARGMTKEGFLWQTPCCPRTAKG